MDAKIKIILPFLINLLSITCMAQPDSNFHIYLLAGQSNMAGRGGVTDGHETAGNSKLFMLNKDGQWIKAKNPVHFDKPKVVGVGPGLSFGVKMAESNPGVKIGLVPCAVGGTSINSWVPGGYDKSTDTRPYDDAVKRVREAMKAGVVKGIIWHQGESDSSPAASEAYSGKLLSLINNFRNVIQNGDIPFVAGELGRYRDVYSNINSVLRTLPDKSKNTAVVSSKGLTHNGDGTHFDSDSAEILGRRFAKKMNMLQRKIKR